MSKQAIERVDEDGGGMLIIRDSFKAKLDAGYRKFFEKRKMNPDAVEWTGYRAKPGRKKKSKGSDDENE